MPQRVILFFLVFLPAFLVAFPALSQEKPMDAASIEILKQRVLEQARITNTISSDFIQEKEMSMIREKIVSRGKFCFKREKMLRWEYLQPFSYLIIINDDQITVMDENKVSQFNVQSNKVFLEINRVILGSIHGTLLSDEQSFKAAFFENATSRIAKLKPLSPKMKGSLSEIVIWFDREDYTVNRLDMVEPGGDFTRISFSGRKLNQPIADEMFMVH